MNIILQNSAKPSDLYIASTRKDPDGFRVVAKRVCSDGTLIEVCGSEGPFRSEELANERCRQRAKTKLRKRGYVRNDSAVFDSRVLRWFEFPAEMRVSPEELMLFIEQARCERYVVFKDVTGIEEWFDIGSEYLAEETSDGLLHVYDRYGTKRECFATRMASVSPTERTNQVEGMLK